ncbi:hypothetical protein IEQ34_010258 [Dendrobium chrysotoxum]|uniref:NADP-dependent oxidoreductase domain-containing protein n=1 Tax=Dendrobium chrysotoxum TaxID=161865 RepID=A0AAV7H568_DENCH|nr:hypothetical protein IEQ34_010258 [Dendrobium chrysotoxum]
MFSLLMILYRFDIDDCGLEYKKFKLQDALYKYSCSDNQMYIDNFSNLANRSSLVDDVLGKVNGLKPIADELGVTLAQLAIAWCASNPNVSSVITGATKESQIIENMKALDVLPKLTPDVLEKIEAVVQTKPKRPESYR